MKVNIFQAEPAMVVGLVTAILVLLTAFGVPISADQKAAILGVVSAVLILLGAVVVRSQVTPTAKPEIPQGTTFTVVTPGSAPNFQATA